MSWDVPWADGGPQVPGLMSPICPGRSREVSGCPGMSRDVLRLLQPNRHLRFKWSHASWDVPGCPGMSQGSFSPTDISGSSGPVPGRVRSKQFSSVIASAPQYQAKLLKVPVGMLVMPFKTKIPAGKLYLIKK